MKLLVFGGRGCLGTELAHAAAERGHHLVAPDRAAVDVTDRAASAAAIRDLCPNAVINATAVVGINPCEADPTGCLDLHVSAILGLADACRELGIPLVQTSTHAVFDGFKPTPYVESDPAGCGHVYGVSKLAGEQLALHRCPGAYVTRFPTMYGRRMNQAPGFVDKMLARLQAGQPCRVPADKLDSPTWALDAARALLDLLENREPGGIYHLANSGMTSYHAFIARLRALIGSTAPLAPAREAEFPGLAPVKPLRNALASERRSPLRPWEDALADYVATVLKPGQAR